MPGNPNADTAWKGMAGSPFTRERPAQRRSVAYAVLMRGAAREDPDRVIQVCAAVLTLAAAHDRKVASDGS